MPRPAADRRIKLLLMSVGSLVGTGLLECLEALGRDRFELIGTNSEPGAVNNFRMDVCYLAPKAVERAAAFRLLDDLVQRHAPDLIVPTRDDDVVLLAHWAAGRTDARALVGSAAMAEVIRDKWSSCAWAHKNGLPFARSAIDAAGVARLREAVGLPLIAKPRDGFGSNGVRMLLSDEHVRAALAAGGQIVQEPLDPPRVLTPDDLQGGMPLWFAPTQPGSALALVLLNDSGCRFVAAWQSSHIRGAAVDTRLLQDAALERLAMDYGEVARRDGWRGLFSLQARPNAAGQPVPIELAGRFMGGTNALHRLGIPVAAIVLREFIAGCDLMPLVQPDFDARTVKQVSAHLVPQAWERTLRDGGVWHGAQAARRSG
jgi:hypothetical protein